MKISSLAVLVVLMAGQQPAVSRPPAAPLESLQRMAQPEGAEPTAVLAVEKAWGGVNDLMPLTRSADPRIRNAAVRALGRLEDPRQVPSLLSLERITVSARADAVAQSLKGFDPAVDSRLVPAALEWMHTIASRDLTSATDLAEASGVLLPMGSIAYATPEQMHKAEAAILRVMVSVRPDPRLSGVYETSLRALEALARLNTRVSGLEEETIAQLEKSVEKQSANDSRTARFHALAALINGRGLTADTEKVALKDVDWEVRRLAATVLAGAGAGLDDTARLRLIEEGLGDSSSFVRYEALRAYVRRGARTSGCGPILNAVNDSDLHVTLAALDALGDACKDDNDVTTRLLAETRVPPTIGSWHRETHAFVALAKRSPEGAATSMEAFVNHPVWWVRMYAAGAAAAAGDLVHLEKLARDANDNVREAAIVPLRRLKKFEADPAIVGALERTDVQLLRTAALLLKESPRSAAVYVALRDALRRLTTEGKETSRDARLALLDAIAVHAQADNATDLVPLLKDFDPKVAEKAAALIIPLTGKTALPEPAPRRRGWPQEFLNLRQCVIVDMAGSGSFQMTMLPGSAPVTVDRFLKLAATDHYYDGLTIHRVVPNFVIQGGGPGANEYSGHKDYMRDEVGGANVRGSVGLSTRGRNTADAQFFINLVDNPRLNNDYTVFASVPEADLAVVDKIQEGDVIRSINISKCGSRR